MAANKLLMLFKHTLTTMIAFASLTAVMHLTLRLSITLPILRLGKSRQRARRCMLEREKSEECGLFNSRGQARGNYITVVDNDAVR